MTQKKGLALLLPTADCLPISFFDPITQTIALAHVSRKTLTQNLIPKTISFLYEKLNVSPSNLHIHIGPHIKKASYAFPFPLTVEHEELQPFTENINGRAHIDLTQACVCALTQAEVPRSHISVSEINTATSENHFSYYRMQKGGRPSTARMATVLMMK